MTSLGPPPRRVLAAFGLSGPVVALDGGEGTSWLVDDVVLKPGVDPTFQEWLGTEMAGIGQRGFRLPHVCRAVGGAFLVEGWGAQSALPGSMTEDGTPNWAAVIGAGRAVHTATAALTRPAFLDSRTDPWARADRAAWAEGPFEVPPELADVVVRLRAALEPLGPAQLIHGDLTTNVLTAPGQTPSIIDFSPYWRPPAYAEGIVIADALCWHAAAPDILDQLDVPVAAVARGLLFRILTTGNDHHRPPAHSLQESRPYQSVLKLLNV